MIEGQMINYDSCEKKLAPNFRFLTSLSNFNEQSFEEVVAATMRKRISVFALLGFVATNLIVSEIIGRASACHEWRISKKCCCGLGRVDGGVVVVVVLLLLLLVTEVVVW